YITWLNDGKCAWTFRGPGAAADNRVEIGAQPVPQEPMVSCYRMIYYMKCSLCVSSISSRIWTCRGTLARLI
ncbi:hypothetical protein BDZ89DRAFT_955589, partial [Hymenopellis radicata]